jgi:hypothetical protein
MRQNPKHPRTAPFRAFAIAVLMTTALAAPAFTAPAMAAPNDSWTPSASERLMKLPGETLKRAVESDFKRSPLAAAISETDAETGAKKTSLADMKAAIARAEGPVRRDLEIRFLEEKKAFITLMKEQQDLRSKRARTQQRLYQRLLDKMRRDQRAESPAVADLRKRQQSARARMEGVVDSGAIDLMQTPGMEESRYGQEYRRNVAAIQSLVDAIDRHPMNQAPTQSGVPISQADFLRQLVAENQAAIALIDQEKQVLGFMAKLVSLDALALSDDIGFAVNDADTDQYPRDNPNDITAAVDLFVD